MNIKKIAVFVLIILALSVGALNYQELKNILFDTFGVPYKKCIFAPGGEYCYTTSGFAGKPCDKPSDCGGRYCFLVNENKDKLTGKGICGDTLIGCHIRIDENGNFGGNFCMD